MSLRFSYEGPFTLEEDQKFPFVFRVHNGQGREVLTVDRIAWSTCSKTLEDCMAAKGFNADEALDVIKSLEDQRQFMRNLVTGLNAQYAAKDDSLVARLRNYDTCTDTDVDEAADVIVHLREVAAEQHQWEEMAERLDIGLKPSQAEKDIQELKDEIRWLKCEIEELGERS